MYIYKKADLCVPSLRAQEDPPQTDRCSPVLVLASM